MNATQLHDSLEEIEDMLDNSMDVVVRNPDGTTMKLKRLVLEFPSDIPPQLVLEVFDK